MMGEVRAELRRLAEAATPGPWLVATGSGPKRRRQQYAVLGVASLRGLGEKGAIAVFAGLNDHRADDAEFCAAARTGVLELLDALDRVEASTKCAAGGDDHELVDAWLREHRKGNLTDHLVDAGFARLIKAEGATS